LPDVHLDALTGANSQKVPSIVPLFGNCIRPLTWKNFFLDALVLCDRLKKMPVPLVYTRHTGRFLVRCLNPKP
jgi:hypothetical protein